MLHCNKKGLELDGKSPTLVSMTAINESFEASWNASTDLLYPVNDRETGDAPAPESKREKPQVAVPIRSLGPRHRERIANHLLALDPADRYLRFGYAASDEQVARYVEGLDFERDEIFGIFNRRLELIAMAHLAASEHADYAHCAEFGVSVLRNVRGRGFGARLFDRAIVNARNDGVSMVFIHALSQNTAMLKIARNAGAVVHREGSESEAFLELPPASADTHMVELLGRQFAEADYRLKKQAKQFWDFLASAQKMHEGLPPVRSQNAD